MTIVLQLNAEGLFTSDVIGDELILTEDKLIIKNNKCTVFDALLDGYKVAVISDEHKDCNDCHIKVIKLINEMDQ